MNIKNEGQSKMAKLARTKAFDWVLTFFSVGMLFFIILNCYWLLRPYNILSWNIPKYEMQKKTYKVGEPLTFRTSFCKNGNYEATIIYSVIDGVKYMMPTKSSKTPSGCEDFISSSLETPNIPSGKYHIESVIIYHVNPLRTVEYRMGSGEFYIENPNN